MNLEEKTLNDVEKDGFALEFIENQTDLVCREALYQDTHNIQFVKNQMCVAAIK